MVPLSVLDLSPITVGSTAADALKRSTDLAEHVERLGYRRFWLAEHHGIPSVASAATAVVMAHVAGATTHIRVGAGGIMLPNHAPLIVAEQFGTLESLFPGRIDLGLGRAPGADHLTAQALRRGTDVDPETFPREVQELQAYFRAPTAGQAITAIPGAGLDVPIWILGSSLFGAQTAAALGLPFAFASHFAPGYLHQAVALYRRHFRPSAQAASPYVMVAVNAFVAETDEEARLLFSSLQQAFVALRRGVPGPLPPPRAGYDASLPDAERALLDRMLSASAVGTPDRVAQELEQFARQSDADELIVAAQIFDHAARRRSFELLARAAGLSRTPLDNAGL
jgi:luciferase family oxidoreductase group 1